ncbi:MAG: precorrin-4 C(11)-methyltransferase, partial [Bacteroidaceae bacterium]|nr:precorrin-4 C(11)-methyltransferase [Bacteroidaceae bacterium]
KRNEPLLAELCKLLPRAELKIYSADELKTVKIPNPSEKVFEVTGCYGVAEASAKCPNKHSVLVIEKQKGSMNIDGKISHYTYALACDEGIQRQGHIEIVGAGPGDPELVSVRGRRFLERADLILYAGSLVPRELTLCAKAGATVRSSADMNLEEQCALMQKFYDQGKLIVRLHTGDPCIFSAIQEQMAYFDAHGMSYHITPGISSFLAAAAELRSQFTIPERCQTIILTRGEGRTPMPEKEKLHLLARSQSTMCIFLSASIVDDVQAQLLQEYPEETPVAACYHLTWPDQRIYRGKLKDLAKIVKDNHLTLTTMIVVGEAIDNRSSTSLLYNKNFSHLYRKKPHPQPLSKGRGE